MSTIVTLTFDLDADLDEDLGEIISETRQKVTAAWEASDGSATHLELLLNAAGLLYAVSDVIHDAAEDMAGEYAWEHRGAQAEVQSSPRCIAADSLPQAPSGQTALEG